MSLLVVGVSDMKTTGERDAELATYALGSCIAVAVHDPGSGVAGMLHFMLPESSIDPAKAGRSPYAFADTGIPALFRSLYERGASKRRLVVRLVGGAQIMDADGVFNIGKRNYLAARKLLWKAGVMVDSEAVGGNDSRSVRLEAATGRLWIRTAGGAEQEMTVAPAGVAGRAVAIAAAPGLGAAEAAQEKAPWRSAS